MRTIIVVEAISLSSPNTGEDAGVPLSTACLLHDVL